MKQRVRAILLLGILPTVRKNSMEHDFLCRDRDDASSFQEALNLNKGG
jgi:hypothetical protein